MKYATYHLLGEPETTIEDNVMRQKFRILEMFPKDLGRCGFEMVEIQLQSFSHFAQMVAKIVGSR